MLWPRFLLFLSLLPALLACGQTPLQGKSPVAVLKAPSCVAVGQDFQMDASDSTDADGTIVRYRFQIGMEGTTLVQNSPTVLYRFEVSSVQGQSVYPVALALEVFDNDGNEDKAYKTLYVVDRAEQCDELPLDQDTVVTPDTQTATDTTTREDSQVADVPSDALSDTTSYDAQEDTGPRVDTHNELFGPCLDLNAPYHLAVYCAAVVTAEIDLRLSVNDACELSDELGILEGIVPEDSQIWISAPEFEQLGIKECQGLPDQLDEFALECANGCKLVLTLL